MRNRLTELVFSALVISLVGVGMMPDSAFAKTYTYKYSEKIKTSFPDNEVVAPVMVERPVVIQSRRPVVMERVVSQPVYISHKTYVRRFARRPVFVRRVVRRPTYVRRVVQRPVYFNRVVERPVYYRRVVERPVVLEQPVVMERVLVKKQSKGIIPKVYGMIFGGH